jgi:hypothetical protein
VIDVPLSKDKEMIESFLLESLNSLLKESVQSLTGSANYRQPHVIDYLKTGMQLLKQKVGAQCVLLNDHQRCRLLVNGQRQLQVASSGEQQHKS